MTKISELDYAPLPLATDSVGIVSVPTPAAPTGYVSYKFRVDASGNVIPLAYDLGAVTESTPLTDLAEEWDNAAVDFVGERRSFTGTAYGSGSVLASYEFDGVRGLSWKPRGDVMVGDQTANPSTDYGVTIARNLFDGLTGNTHGFNHADLIRRSGSLGNASFDAQPRFQANNYDHHAGFQDRPIFQLNAGQAVTNVYGTYSYAAMDTGTITNRHGHYVAAPGLTSGGAITNQYGYYCESLTTGGTNYAYFSAGITPSKFGGPVTVGNQASSSTDPGLLLSRDLFDGLTTNGHGFVCTTLFRRSGTVAYAAFDAFTQMAGNSYDHFAGFQSRPRMQFASGGQTMNNLYGTYCYASIDTGTVTNAFHHYAANPLMTNGGAATNLYGYYCESLTTGGTNWAYFSAGTTASKFGGPVTVGGSTATPAGGAATVCLLFGTTSGFGIYAGSGAPTVSAAKGSFYLRSDGTTTNDRAYINTDGGTTWTALTTAA